MMKQQAIKRSCSIACFCFLCCFFIEFTFEGVLVSGAENLLSEVFMYDVTIKVISKLKTTTPTTGRQMKIGKTMYI